MPCCGSHGGGPGAAGLGVLYNGDSIVSERKSTVQVPANTTITRGNVYGMLFERGIFATVDAATTFLTIAYYPGVEEAIAE